MTASQKQKLADHLRTALTAAYGSVSKAAFNLGLPYEQLKKAMQHNAFNAWTLGILFPQQDVEAIKLMYDFELTRTYGVRSKTAVSLIQSRSSVFGDLLNEVDTKFICENRIVAERLAHLIHEECERLRALLGAT